ncbi:fimbrial biogenesis outer membrane usher protein [Roseateles sp. DAIF2]|uniref:fimbria/pilus outer membrane usher protein n=1 Tax=Roseateles sp. DAIF2 TaxID=2714952 RepID=UPI0018A2871C|nr:fimbria/pilus outer membrane usher protein [Roseateles sp. DAIF2]QPF72641.1 fimbrial biogenesis outer membrane usher protein [Roseateles sp. DAIF2]
MRRGPEAILILLFLNLLLPIRMGRAAESALPPLASSPELARALAEIQQRAQLGETLLLGLRINGVPQPQTLRAVRLPDGLAIPQTMWESLNLKLPIRSPRMIDGELHVLLGDGFSWQIEEATQTLLIELPASAFRAQSLALEAAAQRPTLPARLGLLANYDLQWQRRLSGPAGSGAGTLDGLLELGALTRRGDLNQLMLYRDGGRLLRLETRWTLDRPQNMTRLRIGDTVGQPGAWGRALRLGGVQWGTDFALRPGFLSFPLPTLRGETALPSTLDVYVNNSQRLQGRLQAGAFDISDLPLITGQGEIRTVVRDLLGREQVIVQPYYVSPALLKPGLRAWSLELGRLREDYGTHSNRYGAALLSATERRGISESFTRELRAELQRSQQTLGATGIWLWPRLGTANGSLALSRSQQRGRGWLLAAGLDRQARDWSGSLQFQRVSAGFAQAGDMRSPDAITGAPPSRREDARWNLSAAVGTSWAGHALGLSYVRQDDRLLAQPTKLLSLNWGRDLGGWGYLSLVALRDLAGNGATTIALAWNHALGERSSAGIALTRNRAPPESGGDSQQLQVQVQQNPPLGRGLGYQLLAESGQQRRQMVQSYWQGERFVFNGGVARLGRQTEARAGLSGGLAWMDGSVYTSRRIDGGFVVVQVADYPGIGVLHDNHEVARTDARGRAFIGGLRGYQSNRVAINATDLPYDAELEILELRLIPAARSAALIEFPVTRSRSASFRLVDATGAPLPPGSELQVQGQSRLFVVGLDGRAFVGGLAPGANRVRARWPEGQCSVILQLPSDTAELPELGQLRCLETR